MNALLNFIKFSLLTIPALLLTIYIAVNSIELIFHKDLNYVYAVETFSSSESINRLIPTKLDKLQKIVKEAHQPIALGFPSLKYRLDLVPAVKKDSSWIEIATKGNYYVLTESGESGIGNTLIYLKKDWRTISNPESLNFGVRFYLDAQNYINQYKVIDVQVRKLDQEYILDSLTKPYILLLIEDSENQVIYYTKAVFVTQEKK